MFTLAHLTQRRSCTLRPFPFSPHLKCCCFVFVLQMEVVSTFKRSGSFQGAVRRRSSVLSQLHDVNTISTPSHVALSTATANTSPAPGSESANTHVHTHSHQTSICQQLSASHPLSFLHIQLHTYTQSHGLLIDTAARHVDCCDFDDSLWLCFPSGSLAARVCMQTSPLFPFFLSSSHCPSFIKQHSAILAGLTVYVWSGLVWSTFQLTPV